MHNEFRRFIMPSEPSTSWRFSPVISNHPSIPPVPWAAIGQQAPVVLPTPAGLPTADAVVITWAEAEWAAMQHVFCGNGKPMSYGSRTTDDWPGWEVYSANLPKVDPKEKWTYWGSYRLVQIGAKKVLLFKSNTHLDGPGPQYLEQMIEILIADVKPQLILSIGTAGGARTTDPLGTVNVVNAGTLDTPPDPPDKWPTYANNWQAPWQVAGGADFSKILFPIPTTAADLAAICSQYNAFYHTNLTLAQLNVDDLNTGASEPALNNFTPGNTSLLTTTTFVIATSAGNMKDYACVEMDDAVIAETCKNKGTSFGFVRNISDPVQNVTLQPKDQKNWGSAIYSTYGIYTSYNGACAAWAILSQL